MRIYCNNYILLYNMNRANLWLMSRNISDIKKYNENKKKQQTNTQVEETPVEETPVEETPVEETTEETTEETPLEENNED